MNKTIENLKKLKSFHNGSYGADIDKAIKALEQQKTGHWINIDEIHSKCDRCWAVFVITSPNGEINYCPNCGADMRGEEV